MDTPSTLASNSIRPRLRVLSVVSLNASNAAPLPARLKIEPTARLGPHVVRVRTAELLKEGKTPVQVIEDLYVRCFSRKPEAKELEDLSKTIAGEKNPQAALEDVFWSLLNAKEFVFNH